MSYYRVCYKPEISQKDVIWAITKDRAFAEKYFQECIRNRPNAREVYILKIKVKKIQNMRRR